ncbi:hypothetical protein SAMN04487977_101535 [Treponema bryantii]|uniref:Uncharacterized protein n=1 Tax=Treponema bryantii TaxID=163 RepID=A0A1H9B0T5_9SPIR|nr:hypothetical protein [Treponema bryantii]SEP82469.1 hypothetical protein SAMN04487977_101535 [Treponema bryantii]
MVHVWFEYRDEYCFDGKFHKQECIVSSVEECIKIYGLDNCEYHIIKVEEE